jgi:putative DNA primase/helicase
VGEIDRRAKVTVCAIYGAAASIRDDKAREILITHALGSEREPRIQAMVRLARSEPGIPVRIDQLDADPWLLNCHNGTIELRTGNLRPHDRADLITKLAPVSYDPAAACPYWDAFLERILPEPMVRSFLQRGIGYGLTGDVSEQVIFILYGTGANGKSTLLNVLLDLLGDYGKQAAPELLTVKRGEVHPTEVADLAGCRLVSSIETEEGRRMAEALVKQLSGGDRLKARFMRQDFFEFDPTHKIFLAVNHRPVIRGTDHAIWRRIRLIPFAVTIPEAEQDKHLGDKLRLEYPGILAWAVQGCLAWQREGLGAPEQVREANEAYRNEMDVLGPFLEECCVIGKVRCVASNDLYAAYTKWCQESGEHPISQKALGERLKERGCVPGKGSQGRRTWRGLGLTREGE